MTFAQEILCNLETHRLVGLVTAVCHRRGVCVSDLCSSARTRSVSYARQEVWAAVYDLPDRHYSYSEIARIFGRDHSAVLIGIHAHRRRVAQAPLEETPP